MKVKRSVAIGTMLVAILTMGLFPAGDATDLEKLFSTPLRDKDVAFVYLFYSGMVVRTTSGTVVIDPADSLNNDDIQVLKKNKIDAVLFTHSHGDHFNASIAQGIARETGATIIAEPAVAAALQKAGGIPSNKLIAASAGQDIKAGGLNIQAVPGKHIGPIILYRVKAGSVSFFHGGDSAYVPVQDYRADVAFLPTGSPSPTASPDAALKMALDVQPQVVVLMHGSDAQHADFKKMAAAKFPGVIVENPEPFKIRILSLR